MQIEEQEKQPMVSVIIAAYNAAKYLDEAIESVVSQTMADWELYVIDDCSQDSTWQIAQSWARQDSRIHALHNEENRGVSHTRNRGIELARGRYIALLDADDIWYPHKLERQIALCDGEDVGIVYCSYNIVGRDGEKVRPEYVVPPAVDYEHLLRENCILCSAMLIPAAILKERKFNTEYFHEDYILGLEILGSGYRAVGSVDSLLSWRYAENSRSFNKLKAARNRWRIYRNYLKLPLAKTLAVFCAYTVAGANKYFLRK